MTTFKQILRFPLRLIRRINVAGKIRAFDQSSDLNFDKNRNPLTNGWLTIGIDELLESPGITNELRSSTLHKKPDENKKIYYSWDIPEFLWTAVLNSNKLHSIVDGYLGPDVRLDDMYVKTIQDGFENGAEGWHDDNVGYRLKVFMVFDVEGTPSDTLIIPKNKPNIYKIKFKKEISRMLGFIDVASKDNEVRIKYNAGDCLIFDTNLLHRGDYTHSAGIRYCLVIEFINRKKSDYLKGTAPCSPGQGKFPIQIPCEDFNFLKNHPLLDSNILRNYDRKIWYGS